MLPALASMILVSQLLLAPIAVIDQSERHLHSAHFADGVSLIDSRLADPSLDEDAQLVLVLQKLRIQQNARLAGVAAGNEAATIAVAQRLAGMTADDDIAGRAQLRLAISEYFTRILAGDGASSLELAPLFQEAAAQITAPCRRAEALFFAALMPQIAGHIAESEAGLKRAQVAAGRCPLEQSYVDRHLAVVAENAGDLAAARDLAARSSAIRREIGFDVFLPFSLLLEADLEAKIGNAGRARDLLTEAAALADRLNLAGAQTAVCAEAVRRAVETPHCSTT